MILYIDIDGTICTEKKVMGKSAKDYMGAKPYMDRIAVINKLYDEGHEIHYWTARGTSSGIDWTDLTTEQITNWGCKFHELHVGNKPHFDAYVCDKSWNSDAWFTQNLYEQIPPLEEN